MDTGDGRTAGSRGLIRRLAQPSSFIRYGSAPRCNSIAHFSAFCALAHGVRTPRNSGATGDSDGTGGRPARAPEATLDDVMRRNPQFVRESVTMETMLRAVIIDDVERARRTLGDDLATYCPAVTVIGEASGVATGVNLIKRLKPELVFLDIQLDDGTGFELLECIGTSDFKVIFTTALDSHGIKAIKFSALDYLLKPIDPDELVRAVNKAEAVLTPATVRDSVSIMFDALHGGQRRIALNTADRVYIVQLDEIIRCESQRNYTLFHLVGGRTILVTRTLKEFDDILDGLGFFRTHHSHLVNIRYISEYVKTDGGYAVLSNGSQVPVAVRKKEALLQALGV